MPNFRNKLKDSDVLVMSPGDDLNVTFLVRLEVLKEYLKPAVKPVVKKPVAKKGK